jgi:hypothetical protein
MFLVKSGSIWLQLSLCKIPTSLPQEFMSFRQRCQDGGMPSLLELGDCAKEEEKKQKLNSRHNVLYGNRLIVVGAKRKRICCLNTKTCIDKCNHKSIILRLRESRRSWRAMTKLEECVLEYLGKTKQTTILIVKITNKGESHLAFD